MIGSATTAALVLLPAVSVTRLRPEAPSLGTGRLHWHKWFFHEIAEEKSLAAFAATLPGD